MSLRNKIALALILISFIVLYLGLTMPVLNITLSSKAVTSMGELEGESLNKTRSIMSTIADLYDQDKTLVASLILLFSVIVPVTKGLLLLTALSRRSGLLARRLVAFVKRIGKWSMADVMVVAVYLTYLSTNYQESSIHEELSVIGMKVQVDLFTQMVSTLLPGFYWFLGYCLISLISLEVLKLNAPDAAA